METYDYGKFIHILDGRRKQNSTLGSEGTNQIFMELSDNKQRISLTSGL